MRKTLAILAALTLSLVHPSAARADAQAAKDYVKQAEELSTSGNSSDLDTAKSKLELAETELDGVDAAAKGPIVESIKAVRGKLDAAAVKMWTPKYTRNLDQVMHDAEEAIGNLAIWSRSEDAFKALQDDPMAKTVLGDKLDAAAKKLSTFRKLHNKKAAAQLAEMADQNLKELEQNWTEGKAQITNPDTSPASRADQIDSMERKIADAKKQLGQFPADDARAKGFNDRIDKVANEFTKIALADRVKEVAATLARKIDLYKNDWDGYEQETAGPTFEQYQKQRSEKMSAFLAPKTREYIQRMTALLDGLGEDKDYQSVKSDKSIQATIAELTAKRDAAYQKMLKFVRTVADAAAKTEIKDPNAWEVLREDVRLALGEKSPDTLAIQKSLGAKIEAHAAATTGAEEAKLKLAQTLHAKAEEVWPKLYEGIPYTTEIDLSNPGALKGKNIGFLADNLMGYRFKPGDFYYATTLGGIPVAGKIDPALMKQIKATEAAIGRGLGDNDDDGKWDCIAVVTDQKVKLMARRQVEATGTVGGSNVKVKAEYAEPVDAIVIEIIAAKCGPFAGAKDRGVLKEDGTVGK